MRKIFLPFIAIAIMTFFVACSNEDLITEENTEPNVEGQTISLTASMPEDDPATRVHLEEDGKNITVEWTIDDRIDLVFVKNGQAIKRQRPKVTGVSNDGKTAYFDIAITSEITGEFTLYGVHGGRGTSANTDSLRFALLPTNPGSTSTLASLQIPPQNRKMMLYFKHEMEATDTDASVSFKHLGSLFAISFNNTAAITTIPNVADITQVRLVGVDADGDPLTDGNWAYNNADGGQIFDLTAGVAGEFLNQESAGNYISFSTVGRSFPEGETTTLWGWYPPIPEQTWPALRLVMTESDGSVITPSLNFRQARATAPEAGKVYHFYARWDGTELNFTDASFNVNP